MLPQQNENTFYLFYESSRWGFIFLLHPTSSVANEPPTTHLDLLLVGFSIRAATNHNEKGRRRELTTGAQEGDRVDEGIRWCVCFKELVKRRRVTGTRNRSR